MLRKRGRNVSATVKSSAGRKKNRRRKVVRKMANPRVTNIRRYALPHLGQPGSDSPLLSVIIPAMNEEKTVGRVVREARRITSSAEVIVVVNGSTDHTAAAAAAAGARVIVHADALGHDGGRRVGAAEANGNILLFTDADIVIPSEQLAPFVQAIVDGTDVALNDYSGPIKRNPIHPVIEAKHALNSILGRSDLKGAALTAIPHAISRKALDIIGLPTLEIPPLALAKAVGEGLQVRAVHHVPVGKMNRTRLPRRTGPDPLGQIILNDHLNAIKWLTDHRGQRGGFPDLDRIRVLAR